MERMTNEHYARNGDQSFSSRRVVGVVVVYLTSYLFWCCFVSGSTDGDEGCCRRHANA